jgi:hypothetical protein
MFKRMTFVYAAIVLLSTNSAAGQVPSYGFSRNQGGGTSNANRSLPANNPWIVAGAQIGYKFSGNSDFADGLLASSRIGLQTLRFPGQGNRVGLPLIGNLSRLSPGLGTDSIGSISDRLTNTAEGINVGLYPYFESIDRTKGGPAQVTFYGSTVWKLNAARDRTDSSTVYLNQGRFTMGVGVDLYIAENNTMPVSFSIEPVLTLVSADAFERVTGRRENRIYSVELTGVLPIGNNMGLLAQLGAPDDGETLFRVGVIYVASPASSQTGSGTPGAPPVRGAIIDGTVVDAADKPLAARTVTAQFFSGATAASADKCTDGQEVGDQVTAQSPTTDAGAFQIQFERVASEANCVVFEITGGAGNNQYIAQTVTLSTSGGAAAHQIGPVKLKVQ